jgi:hypothetical protein
LREGVGVVREGVDDIVAVDRRLLGRRPVRAAAVPGRVRARALAVAARRADEWEGKQKESEELSHDGTGNTSLTVYGRRT